MRIRKHASKVLGSAYFTPAAPEARPPPSELLPRPPPPAPASYAVNGGAGPVVAAAEGVCGLNQNPWDLSCEQVQDDSNPEPQDAPFEKFLVHITRRVGWSSTLSSMSVKHKDHKEMDREDKIGNRNLPEPEKRKLNMTQDAEKKIKQQVKENNVKEATVEADKVIMVIEEDSLKEAKDQKANNVEEEEEARNVKEDLEADQDKQAKVWYCRKNDGKQWNCRNIVGRPNTLCDYHFAQRLSYYTPSSDTVPDESAKASIISTSKVKASVGSRSSAPPRGATASKSALVKASCSSKPAPARAASSSRAIPADARPVIIAPSSPNAPPPASAPASSKARRKRRTANDSSGEDFYYYDLFGPFRSKHRGDSSRTSTPETRHGKKYKDDDGDDLSDHNAWIAGGDEERDEDYVVGVGNDTSRAKNGKGNMTVENVSFPKKARKKCVKARSLKSLL